MTQSKDHRRGQTANFLVPRKKGSLKGTGSYETEKLLFKNTIKHTTRKTPRRHDKGISEKRVLPARLQKKIDEMNAAEAHRKTLLARCLQLKLGNHANLHKQSAMVLARKLHEYEVAKRLADGKTSEERAWEELQ